MSGSIVAVKRFLNAKKSEEEFIYEMMTLVRVKHHNLVPLVGFCIARKERLLVYKHV